MVHLGLDFGLKHVGLALAIGPLAEPLANLKISPKIFKEIQQICLKQNVGKLVVGISEGKMAQKTHEFTQKLAQTTKIPIVFQDETLTTQQVTLKLIEARSGKMKRKGPKHAFAATLILQEYLDSGENMKY